MVETIHFFPNLHKIRKTQSLLSGASSGASSGGAGAEPKTPPSNGGVLVPNKRPVKRLPPNSPPCTVSAGASSTAPCECDGLQIL